MNTPYVRQMDANGTLANPITKENPYVSIHPNRRERRHHPGRFRGNNKGHAIVEFGGKRWEKILQHVRAKDGRTIVIPQYVEC